MEAQHRTDGGVPGAPTGPESAFVSDPLQGSRAAKRWTRVGVYLAILGYGPLYLFVFGYALRQVFISWTVGLIIATIATELAFAQVFKLRKRGAYPGVLLAELGSGHNLNSAAEHCLGVIKRLMATRAAFLALGSGDDIALISVSGIDREAAEGLLRTGMIEVRAAMRSQQPVSFKPATTLAEAGLTRKERLIFTRVAGLQQPIGVLAVIGHRCNPDLKDGQLLSGIGVALGLSLESLRQKQELRESEERYRDLFENANDIIYSYTFDPPGKVTSLNKAAERVTGYTLRELSNVRVAQLAPLEYHERIAELIKRQFAGEAPVATEIEIIAKDGRRIPLEVSPRLIVKDGKPVAVQAIARDITERKRAQDALRQSEERLRCIFEAASEGICIHENGVILDANPAFEEMAGYSLPELVGRSVLDLAAEESRDLIVQNVRSGTQEPYEAVGLRKDGTTFSAELIGKEHTYKGRRVRVVAVRDITERKRAEAALQESETKFRTLTETIAAAAFIFQGTRLRYVNSAAEIITGYTREELLTIDFLDLIHPDCREHVKARGLAHQRGESIAPRYETKLLTKDGDERWVDITVGVTEFEGKPAVMGTGFDVTERKRAEDALRESEEKYRDLVENISEIIYALDKEGRVTYVSPVVEQIGGYRPSEVIGRSFAEFIHPDDLAPLIQSFERTVSGNLEPSEYRILAKSGEARWVRTSSRLVYEGGQVVGLRAVLMDITDRKQAEGALRESEDLYRSLVDTSPDAVIRVDLDGNTLMANRQAMELLGIEEAEEVLGRDALEFIAPEDRRRVRADIRRTSETGIIRNIEYTLLRKGDRRVPAELSASLLVDTQGNTRGYVCVVRDITERKRAEETIRHLAYHDALTGLPNRTLFQDRLAVALAQARRKKRALAVLFLDLDQFKVVNDTVGHAEGDKLLGRVAERLTGLVREGDTVARVGGDEFTLLFPEVGGADDAADIGERVLRALQQPWSVDGHEFHVTTSVGIALYPSDGDDAESLLRNADTAMYRAKEQGRNNCQLYAPAMNARIMERLALESSLRHGLERDEFVVYYQPQVNIRTGQVVGVEALVRWQHPERGLVLPAEFIPVAEETGLIMPLGEGVLRAACVQNKAWQENGLAPMRVAVNLSARQFQQRDLIDVVAQVLRETGLPPHLLQLEITEGTTMHDVDFTIAMLRNLREMGVQIAIDDFGIGYSSLAYLKRLPIDAVKIDQSFIRDLTIDPDDAAIAATVITMAHNLKLSVIAEGVETEEQLAFLSEHECDEMQGYLFSKPVPAEVLEKTVRTGRRRPRARTTVDSA